MSLSCFASVIAIYMKCNQNSNIVITQRCICPRCYDLRRRDVNKDATKDGISISVSTSQDNMAQLHCSRDDARPNVMHRFRARCISTWKHREISSFVSYIPPLFIRLERNIYVTRTIAWHPRFVQNSQASTGRKKQFRSEERRIGKIHLFHCYRLNCNM